MKSKPIVEQIDPVEAPVVASAPSRRRRGAILVVVAGIMIALMLFAAYAVDVGYMHLTRAQAENATRAAAWAGYERLKKLNFNVLGNEAAIEATIRNYLESNGVTQAEAAAAVITYDRRGEITVQVSKGSPTFFGKFSRRSATAVAGAGLIAGNKLAPFAIPSTYQDPDRNGYSNWNISDQSIETSPTPWDWKLHKPYIIKYGRDSGQPGNNENWYFIPMDDNSHTAQVAGQNYTIPAQDVGGSLVHTPYNIDKNYAQRANLAPSTIGIIRAYGIAYDIAGVADSNIFWVLGYAGGSFLLREADLLAAGYTVSGESGSGLSNSKKVTIRKGGSSTGVIALSLKSMAGDPNYRVLDLAFLNKLDVLTATGKINLLKIPKQPKILTLTESNDPVTCSMLNAGIPFHATFFTGHTRPLHDFTINPNATTATILNKLRDPTGALGGPFDWLHLHHENFAKENESTSTPYGYTNFVEAVNQFVRNEHRFIFGACWAAETLEIALARAGSSNWTADGGVPILHVADHDADPNTQAIEYGKTFAFQDFYVSQRSSAEGDALQGSISNRFPDDTNGGRPSWEDSEIDNGYQNPYTIYLDYKNPLLQNHGGYAGFDLNENTDLVNTSYNSSDFIRTQLGATDSFRYHGEGHLHCPENLNNSYWSGYNRNGNAKYFIERTWGNRPANYSRYNDPREGDPQYVYEDALNCDIDGDGDDHDYIRIRDLVKFKIPCGSGSASGSYKEHAYLDGRDSRGDYYRLRHGNNDGYTDDIWENAVYRRNLELCASDPGHTIYKASTFAQGGYTVPQEITSNNNTRVMILSRPRTSNRHDYATLTHSRYISGTGDNDNDLSNGFGRWSYLGGHWPGTLNGRSTLHANNNHHSGSDGDFGLAGMRTYLNNILFGSTAGIQPGGAFTPGTGAVNPGGLGLGGTSGAFGATGGFTGNSYSTMFRVGARGLGVPVGAKFTTAPGNFAVGTTEGHNAMFQDESGNSTSVTWDAAKAGLIGKTDQEQLQHPQVIIAPVVERIWKVPGSTNSHPTPEAELDDFLFPASSPADSANDQGSANGARHLSIYGGDPTLPEDDPGQAQYLHVTGFAKFFVIDKDNQSPNTSVHPGGGSIGPSFVTTAWKEGEVRGHFLGYIDGKAPPAAIKYPNAPFADPR